MTDPQIRRLLAQGTLQLSLFSEQVCEVQGEGVRYILRRNPDEAQREQHRLDNKLAKLEAQIQARNEQVRTHPAASRKRANGRCKPGSSGTNSRVSSAIPLEGTQLKLQRNEEAIARALELAGCYVVATDVASSAMSPQQVHDSYVALQKVERDSAAENRLAASATGLGAQRESHAGARVCCLLALKVSRELERRLRAVFGTTETRADAITLPDALLALTRLCLLHYAVDEKTTVTKLPQPDARQQEILNALGVTLPAL